MTCEAERELINPSLFFTILENPLFKIMERVSKLALLLTAILVVAAMPVEGGRMLKSNEKGEVVAQPQNIYGGVGGIYPGSPGFTGIGFGPSGFCSLPGGCVPTGGTGFGSVPLLPTNNPGVPLGGGGIPLGAGGVSAPVVP